MFTSSVCQFSSRIARADTCVYMYVVPHMVVLRVFFARLSFTVDLPFTCSLIANSFQFLVKSSSSPPSPPPPPAETQWGNQR